jgi:hypothetical protein
LPREITALGISEDYLSDVDANEARAHGWPKALALQKQLLKLAGWPNCRQAYEENLREAEEDAAHCRDRVEHPPSGEYGTGTDPESRRERMLEAEDEVAYRKQLLAELGEVQKKWARP